MQVQSLASLSELRIQHCRELWYRSQTRHGPRISVTVAQACSCSSNSTPSLGTSICFGCGPKKKKKKCCHDLNIHVEQAAGSPASMQGSSEEKKRILISTSELWPIAHLEGNPHGGESSAGTLNPSTPQSGPYGMKFLCKIPCE